MNKKHLHQVVEHLLRQHQGRIAIEQGGHSCRYDELDRRSGALCIAMQRLGVGRGDVVALPMPASIDYVVALIATVRCGAIFLPLDPAFPETRLRTVLSKTNPAMIVGNDAGVVARIAALAGAPATLLLQDLAREAGQVQAQPQLPPQPVAGEDDTGYLITTSGSTGEPKLIAGRNKGISHFVHWEVSEFGIDETVRASFFAPPTFDVSLREIFVPLLAGGILVIPDPEVRGDARRLVGWLRDCKVTLMHCVPSLFRLLTRALAEDMAKGGLPELRMAALAGEPLYGADISAWRAAAGPATQLVNLYGPSETSLAKAFHRIGDDVAPNAIVPLGQPIRNTALLILRDGRLCDIGEIGELHISTPFASNGYFADPNLTAQAFVANPLAPESADRIYRTGDLARYRADRSVEFVGRADRQVKVNGVRIELPEIEAAMRCHAGVTEAVAHTFRVANGDNILVGYYTADAALDAQALRAAMQTVLPAGMLPGYLLQLPEFPRNFNGKIDRKALPRPEALLDSGQSYTAPEGELEQEISRMWAEALGLERVGATSPYLQIGGNSLRAIGLIGRIGQRFGVDITIRDFFESGTVRALAERVAANRKPARQAIPFAADREDYPLTDAQSGLWLLDRISHSRTLYNNVEWLELHGALDRPALESAFHSLVERHESLRTAYIDVDGVPRQRVLHTADFSMHLHELESAEDAQAQLREMLEIERHRHFNLSSGQVLHVSVVKQTPELHHLIINMHHIACDGWSMGILVRELANAYQAARSGAMVEPAAKERGLAMRDLACWQADQTVPESRAGQWRARLSDADKRAAIPPDAFDSIADNGASGSALAAGCTRIELSSEQTGILRNHLAGQGATPYMAVASALAILLYRYGGSETVVIGTPVAGRSRSELADVVGFMVNTLPLVLRLTPDMSFSALLDRTRQSVEELSECEFDNAVQFATWLSSGQAAIDASRNPLFDVVLAMEPAPAAMPLGDMQVIEREVPEAPARNDLSLRLQDDGAKLSLVLEYRKSLYSAATAARLLDELGRLLTRGCETPALPIRGLGMLSEQQMAALLQHARGPVRQMPQTTIHACFAAQAKAMPDAAALVGFDGKIDYRWLDRRANRIAAALIDTCGVQPGDVVAVLLDREADWPAAILGILKAGAVYLPLDGWHPAARHAQLCDDAGARVLVSRNTMAAALHDKLPVLDLAALQGIAEDPPALVLAPESPAYLIYTSGSTGTPKGVLVSHLAFLNMIGDQIEALDINDADTVMQFVSPAFDVSLFEIFLALLSGARLALADRRLCGTAEGFAQAVDRLGITVAAMTPGFLNSIGDLPLSGLRIIVSGGEEPIAADVQRRLGQGIRYVNAYGPTESAVCAAFHEFDPTGPLPRQLPLGRPTANTALHVVAPDLTPLPHGAVGELAIAGAGLAIGYFRRPSMTEQAFVNGTLAAGEQRLYRTGDRVRRNSDGALVFVGRNDSQVKIRGHRIEIGEVESALRGLPGVGDARVLPRRIGQDLELVAYWTGDAQTEPGLRRLLAESLPEYMVPRLLMRLDALPLNENGKLDRSRLPDPAATDSPETGYQPPRTADEVQLAALWSELLGRERVGRDDNFFDCGGRSLAANRLALRAARALGIRVEIRDIYAAPTPAKLALHLRSRCADTDPALPRLPDGEPAPLSPMQRRLWVIDQLGESGAAYHICGLTRLSGRLDIDALRAAFDDVAARQAVLRTRFETRDGNPVQVTDSSGRVPWTVLPLDLGPDFQQTELESIANSPFRLSQEWPIRVALAAEDQSQWKLLIVLHHIAADGWSMPILESELAQAYAARVRGKALEWTPLQAQYRDVAAWMENQLGQDAHAEDRAYWMRQFDGEIPLLDLPADRPRPAVRRFQGASIEHVLSDATVSAVHACAQAHGVSLFAVLLSGLQTLLYRLSGQDDLIVGVPVAGRQHPAAEGLVGFFVNTLPLRERIAGEQGFASRLAAAAETTRHALAHQNYPFDRLVSELNIARDTSRSALFDVMIGLDETTSSPALPGLDAQPLTLARSGSRCDMTWMFSVGTAGAALRVEFDTDLFDQERVIDWTRRFEHLLCAAIGQPQQPLNQLDLLYGQERAALRQSLAQPAAGDAETTVLELFEAHAASRENAAALLGDGVAWTYGELNRAANRMARRIGRMLRKPGVPVALALERGPLMVLAQLAVMKCGASYLPIEPDAPAERIALLLEDSGADLLLLEPGSSLLDGDNDAVRRVALSIPPEGEEDSGNLPSALLPEDPIYVMYTSGSTGRPKGVVALHRGVMRLVRDSLYYEPEAGDRILQLSNYAFDGATFDFYAALANGLPLCLMDKETLLDPQALAAFVQRHGANVSFITTALFNRIVDEAPAMLAGFRRLFFGGQEASLSHVGRALRHMSPGALAHVYGPTECTTFATWHTVRTEDLHEQAVRLPIGKPVAQTSAVVLDTRRMPVPPGVPGELYLGGAGLAGGYLGSPELTADRFVASPFDPEQRLYRTGDLCTQRADGTIEFLGRLDGQVKVRGFRIELGEVEHHVAAHPGVEKVHVMPRRNDSGNIELVAYLTAREAAPPSLQSLRDHLAQSLPQYMLPSHFVLLDEMPLNRNGKVDRAALPAPEAGALSLAEAESLSGEGMSSGERALLDAWRSVLRRDAIGLHDNYYAIGGDSIQAIQIVSRLRAAGFALKVTDLLRYPTIAQLAPMLGEAAANKRRTAHANEDIPLTPIQHWMLERKLPSPQHFNQSVLLRLPDGDAARMARALSALEARHESLRLRFGVDADGKAWQRLAPVAGPVGLDVHAFDGTDAVERMQEEINRLQRSLLPETGPLWRAALFRLNDGHRLFLTIHHWAVDGVSWRILLEDLATAHQHAADPDAAIALPETGFGFHDWALALKDAASDPRFAGQADYWRRQSLAQAGRMPVLADVPAAPLRERASYSFALPRDKAEALFGACHDAYRTRSDELLLAAWVHALTQVQGHPACRIALESHGREALADSIDVGRTVGWFTAIYPLVFTLEGSDWSSHIRQVKETLRNVPDNGIGYGLLRYLGGQELKGGHAPEVVFNYLGRFDHQEQALPVAAESTGDELDPAIRLEQGLDVSAELRDGVLQVRLTGDTARHPDAFFRSLKDAFSRALEDVIAHCLSADAGGLSPSDVDLQGIGIDDLDSILDSLEGS
ncbi:non-ribosomal peptide synthetase [Noviherbaspirillum album]|uniref:non-ribosomal peptide synthetase n=1 Tax=Noviherbaspirillum album TaxID=3080276 RepID=UPI002DD6944A|nr:non-ribosomal peptide synthetase [Noviherbaspirillum sp. CPCC 100848]